MTRSKQSSKSLAKSGQFLNILLFGLILSSCTYSTSPTFSKEDIANATQDICKNEYKIDVRAKLVGQTLWVYLPLSELFSKADKPEKTTERFQIKQNAVNIGNDLVKTDYLINSTEEKSGQQEYKFNKEASEKMNNVLQAVFRVILSMERHKKREVQFFCLIAADIKNGVIVQQLSYVLDLKKFLYRFISLTEYQHRSPQDIFSSTEIIGDKEGMNIAYKDISLEDFIGQQIQYRIRLDFQKPEAAKGVNIDKEIIKIVVHTLKIYDFKDFSSAEITNLATNNKVVLNQAAIWARPKEEASPNKIN